MLINYGLYGAFKRWFAVHRGLWTVRNVLSAFDKYFTKNAIVIVEEMTFVTPYSYEFKKRKNRVEMKNVVFNWWNKV